MPNESVDQLVERMLNGDVTSRRAFVQRLGAAGFALTGASTLLAACGGVEGTANKDTASQNKAVTHPKVAISQLNFSNWPLYVDKKVLKDWDKQTGGKLKYTEDINDNEEFFGKIRQPLAQGQDTGRDLVALTDWMAARMVRLGYVQPVDKKNIPNGANIIDALKAPNWDKQRNFSLPWQSGMTAIGYNPKKTGREITSVNDLFDPKFKGRMALFSDARDTSGLVMLSQGIKPADAKIDDVLKALDKVDEENRKGQIRKFTGNDYTTDLTKGNLWLCMAYSGDIIQLQADNPDLKFVIPEEGAMLWSDNMMIPKKAQHVYAAENFMNYVYDPKVAAKITAYVNYVSPVKGVKEELAKTDPKLASDPLIFPTDADLAKLSGYPVLSETEEKQMNEKMQQIVGA
jgi:spermidine/putrescine transport system substrate-binding protein